MATAELDADQIEGFSGLKKAAILLVTLGEEASSKILKTFSEDEVHVLGREVARLQHVSTESSEKILEEFYQMSVAHDYVLKGGVEYARNMLINAFGPEQARAIVIVRCAPQLAAAGLAVALAVAFVPVALGDPVMTHRPAAGAKVLHFGSIEGLTAVLFDVGVFLLVLGFSVGALDLAATMRERRRP